MKHLIDSAKPRILCNRQFSVLDLNIHELSQSTYINRKQQGLSQPELAAKVGLHTNALDRYERGDAVPSVEVAAKIAGALSTSLDYLTDLTDIEFDSNIVNRINEIASLLNEDREHVFKVVVALIRDA